MAENRLIPAHPAPLPPPAAPAAAISVREALDEFLLDRRGRGLKPRTLEFYRAILEQFVTWLEAQGVADVSGIVPAVLRRFDEHLVAFAAEHGWRPGAGGLHAHARGRRAFLKFLEQEAWLPAGSASVRMPAYRSKHRPSFTPEDLARMVDDCSGRRRRYSLEGKRDLTLVLLLADTGLRRAEAVSLNWGDVDLVTGAIMVTRTKGGRPRSVFVGPSTLRAIRRYRRTVPHELGDPLLQARIAGRRLASASLREVLRRMGRRVALPDLSPHQFRRFFATNALRGGIDLLALQRLLGHASVSQTSEYVGLTPVDLQRAHLAASPVEALRQRRDR